MHKLLCCQAVNARVGVPLIAVELRGQSYALSYLKSIALQALTTDALILAKASGHDVFNALDCLQNQEFLKVLESSSQACAGWSPIL